MSSQNSGFYTPAAEWYSKLNDYNYNQKRKISVGISGVSTVLLAEPEIQTGTRFTRKWATQQQTQSEASSGVGNSQERNFIVSPYVFYDELENENKLKQISYICSLWSTGLSLHRTLPVIKEDITFPPLTGQRGCCVPHWKAGVKGGLLAREGSTSWASSLFQGWQATENWPPNCLKIPKQM